MRRLPTAILAAGLVGAFAFAAPATSGPDHKNKFSNDHELEQICEHAQDAENPDTVTYGGPLKLWPPNHKMQDFSVTALEEPPGTPDAENDPAAMDTTLEVFPSMADAMGGDGGGNHDPDWQGEPMASGDPDAVVEGQLRAERSGRGEGRTYTLDWTAVFDDGEKVCTTRVPEPGDENFDPNVVYVEGDPFVIDVPHDMRTGHWKDE